MICFKMLINQIKVTIFMDYMITNYSHNASKLFIIYFVTLILFLFLKKILLCIILNTVSIHNIDWPGKCHVN